MYKVYTRYKQNNKMLKKNFTLIELLISILILSIWILTLANISINYLNIAENTKIQTQATLLSKEWLELIYLLKQTNKERKVIRNCTNIDTTNGKCNQFLSWHDIWQISYNPLKDNSINIWKSIIEVKPTNLDINTNKLYKHILQKNWKNIIYYNYNSTNWLSTPFSRILKINKVYSQPDWKYLPKSDISKISSIVFYKKWILSWKIELETFIWKY